MSVDEFKGFSHDVWDPRRWKRGAPPKQVTRSQRSALKCSANEKSLRLKQRAWRSDKHVFYHERGRCLGGAVYGGLTSTFGPPSEGAGTTATGVSSGEPGFAMYNQATLGERFLVTVQGHSAYLTQTDIGPAPWTGRTIDITGAGLDRLGLSGSFVTDSYGEARLVPGGC